MRFLETLKSFWARPVAVETTNAVSAVSVQREAPMPVDLPPAAAVKTHRPKPAKGTPQRLIEAKEALEANPGITAGEFANITGLSKSYAASLLRRARTMPNQHATEKPVPGAASIRQRTGDLHRCGNSLEAIAAELGIPRAEVEFLIRLEELLQAA